MNFKEKLNTKRIGKVEVPEVDATFYVRSWSSQERMIFANSVKDWPHVEHMARLCCLSLCDEQGQRLFQDDEFGELAEADGVVVERIGKFALKFNGLDTDAVEDAKKN